MRNILGIYCRENQNIHFTFHNLYRKSCRLRDNEKYLGPDRPQMKIRCMCMARWIPKA